MLGWEFPPVFSGGLGVVTKNLVEHLSAKKQDVTLLLPYFIAKKVHNKSVKSDIKKLVSVPSTQQIEELQERYKTIRIPTMMESPYISSAQYNTTWQQYSTTKKKNTSFVTNLFEKTYQMESDDDGGDVYGETLFQEIERFVEEVLVQTENRHFDVVHAHDWITAEAAIQLKQQRGIPMMIHIHATEVDRTGKFENLDGEVYRREKYAMEVADKVITVSEYTKNILVTVYGIDPDKIEVVYNAYEKKKRPLKELEGHWQKDKDQFWVLFIGRVTLQKGPDYFIDTAKKCVAVNPNVHFLIAGDGDMMPTVIDTIAKEKLQSNVHCLGFLTASQRDSLYRFTDACIIPSVSEPFGLTAIEVVHHRTPLIVSKNCGANEVIPHKLEVDFWDSEQMAEYVLALQKYPALRRTLRNKAKDGLPDLSWSTQVDQLIGIYKTFL